MDSPAQAQDQAICQRERLTRLPSSHGKKLAAPEHMGASWALAEGTPRDREDHCLGLVKPEGNVPLDETSPSALIHANL